MNNYVKECMECIYKDEDILFTFKEDAERFAKQQNLKIEYIESMTDDDHYQIKGYKSKLYWIA